MTITLMLSSGFMLGLILDTYHVFKQRFQMRGWVVSLVDLLYWSVSAVLVFSLLWWSNWGELRFYIFVAVCLGFFFYYQWLSKLAIRLLGWLIDLMEKILYGIVRVVYVLLWIPVVRLVRFVRSFFSFLLRTSRKLLKFLLFPIWWILRPIWIKVEPSLQKMKQPFHKLAVWWKKMRKKGE
jgi:spore cortex biosynthesis protein YabQ